MNPLSGIIYLADARGVEEAAQFRRYRTFGGGASAVPERAPFGRLVACHEELLAGGARVTLPSEQAALVLVLPIIGGVTVGLGDGMATTVEVEAALVRPVPAGGVVEFVNPYPDETVTLLHLWLRAAEVEMAAPARTFPYSFEALTNRLHPIVSAAAELPFVLSLGRFVGRHEALYPLRDGAQLFALALSGAFEMQGRLLHEKDGLALWDTPEADVEALSNNALLLALALR